ncbi:MAG: hypothetical protein QUV08_00165 [Parasphingorhabdus sp.]|nr:hypothetical protein [Parasphingorhabdus sp.]
MDWDLIYTITNNYALLMWLILAFAPRRPAIVTGLFYGGVGLLAGTYAVIIIPLMTGLIDGGGTAAPDFTTLRRPAVALQPGRGDRGLDPLSRL